MSRLDGRCACGKADFIILGGPLLRCLCHCTICQSFNDSRYADVAIFRQRDIVMPHPDLVDYEVYKFPSALQRGKSSCCGSALIEFMDIPLFPSLVIVPVSNVAISHLIDPSFHIFNEKRKECVSDVLPKYQGFWRSQLALTYRLAVSLRAKEVPDGNDKTA
ncbi:GFA family protein [Zhongshania marina]|uniref:CENP-V/GFA domain-containing protein n=1 Tax=Zhongshania marina TaxID=2304603 RepID=A0ABX9W3K9_9GAMM|nr:hypothetical protein D0911_06695 [Zhongshania marina]